MNCEFCGKEFEHMDSYLYLNNYEKEFCCEDCLVEWLIAYRIAEWDVYCDEEE